MLQKKEIDWEVVRRMSAFVLCGIGLILTLIGSYVGLRAGIWTLCWVGLVLTVAVMIISAIVVAAGVFESLFVAFYIPWFCIMMPVLVLTDGIPWLVKKIISFGK